VLLTTEETDPQQWWVLEEAGHHPQMDDPLCHSRTV
jgi:hypothetical protein